MKKPIPFGKYYLLERINVGGMAEVFRAEDIALERPVAVKLLPGDLEGDPAAVRRLRRCTSESAVPQRRGLRL